MSGARPATPAEDAPRSRGCRDGRGVWGDGYGGPPTGAQLLQISQHRFAHDAESDKSDFHLFLCSLLLIRLEPA